MKNRPIIWFFVFTCVLYMAVGCGKKTMPVPYPVERVSPVTDLTSRLDGDIVTLYWTVPDKTKPDKHISGFIIYRSKIAPGGCKGCPVTFGKLAEIPNAPYKDNRMRYDNKLEKGYRYIFKIVTLGEDGQRSNDSPWVEIIHDLF